MNARAGDLGDLLPRFERRFREQYADEIAAGHLDRGPSGYLTETDGTRYVFGPAYAGALGCEGQYKRRVN